jgi:hypothetical protein
VNDELDREMAELEASLHRLRRAGPARGPKFWTDFTRNVRLGYDQARVKSGRRRFWFAAAILTTTLASLVAVAWLQPHRTNVPPSAALALIAPSDAQVDDDLDEGDADEWEELDTLDTAALQRVATVLELSQQKRANTGAATGAAN